MKQAVRLLPSLICAAVLLLSCSSVTAQPGAVRPFVAPIFTDNMVLQRDKPLPVWGNAAVGESIVVSVGGQTQTTTAGTDGKWMVRFNPLQLGPPVELVVKGKKSVAFKNVLVGDVWVCAGQSNMDWPLTHATTGPDAIASAYLPDVRLLAVPKKASGKPQSDLGATVKWAVCSPQTVGSFSAVGYFFGRELNQKLRVPIGIIQSSWGETGIEAWMGREAWAALPDSEPVLTRLDKMATDEESFDAQMAQWWRANDPGTKNNWSSETFDAKAWKTMQLPKNWENAGLFDYDGVVWFRREVEVPAAWAGKDLTMQLGPIADRDTTYFNGTPVGTTQNVFGRPFKIIPGNLVKAGRNVIAVRVLDTGDTGGFVGRPDQMRLEFVNAPDAPIDLTGPWLYREGPPLSKLTPVPPVPPTANPNTTSVLYNGMVAPLIPSAIRGVVWYQGESNVKRADAYRAQFPALISDWRRAWGQGDFPFYFVQLAGYMSYPAMPVESQWADLREAQALALQSPQTGMAVTLDIGDADDMHPHNKEDVGKRLALVALANDYGQQLEFSGPMYQSMSVEGNKIRLTYTHATGLKAKGTAPRGFAVLGEQGKWVWANARIEGENVVVWNDTVKTPTAVRYAWSDNAPVNLYNAANLPAVPFRTDSATAVSNTG